MKWIEELIKLRNELYEDLPKGEISSWELLSLIKLHINDLDSLIHRNSASLPSSSVTGEEVKDQKWFINQGIEFSKKMKTDSEAYKLGAGFGYSCGLQDGYKTLPVTGESEAIEERKFTLIEALDIWGDGCDTGGQQWSYETDMEKRDEYFKDKFGIDI